MSRQTALDNISLKPTDRWGHTEYSVEYHNDFIAKCAAKNSDDTDELRAAAYDNLSMDFIWNTNDGLIDWAKAGRVTNMGHAEYAADGGDKVESAESPFKSYEDVWAFDAVTEYGLPDFDDQVAAYEAIIQKSRKKYPGQLTTGGHYKSIVSGAIEAFGWEMLLMAASDPDKMEKVLDSFFRRTLFFMKAWAKTSAEVLIQHDDFVWTSGPFVHPDFYRQVIIPRYKKLWEPVHEAGKKLMFCSDGNFAEFAQDVIDAGADGLIFEPCMDFGDMVKNYGQQVCLVGSYVDCRDLTFGKWDKVQADIDKTFEALQQTKGALFAVGNHLPANITDDMMEKFFDYLLPRLKKEVSLVSRSL